MSESDWTLETLHQYLATRLANLQEMLQERYETQTKALDAAFAAAERAVQTALQSQEKAVNKAESAAERRFESVNEFRKQLNDQAATFVTRNEYSTAHQALIDRLDVETRRSNEARSVLTDKIEAESKRAADRAREMELRLTARLELITGSGLGASKATTLFLTIGGLILTAIVITTTIILATRG